jgi:hypothetical protein
MEVELSIIRPLPTHDDRDRAHITYEYGFHEPPLDKMQPGKLMFREVMDVSLELN